MILRTDGRKVQRGSGWCFFPPQPPICLNIFFYQYELSSSARDALWGRWSPRRSKDRRCHGPEGCPGGRCWTSIARWQLDLQFCNHNASNIENSVLPTGAMWAKFLAPLKCQEKTQAKTSRKNKSIQKHAKPPYILCQQNWRQPDLRRHSRLLSAAGFFGWGARGLGGCHGSWSAWASKPAVP